LRPVRAALFFVANVPKPTNTTGSSFFKESVIASSIASIARPAAAFGRSALAATASINSDLFTLSPFQFEIIFIQIAQLTTQLQPVTSTSTGKIDRKNCSFLSSERFEWLPESGIALGVRPNLYTNCPKAVSTENTGFNGYLCAFHHHFDL
jgi:hypothetical protein